MAREVGADTRGTKGGSRGSKCGRLGYAVPAIAAGELSACPPLIAVGFRELGAEQKDLGRVIDPHENDDERARARRSTPCCCFNVQADGYLPTVNPAPPLQPRAKPDVLPLHRLIRKYLEHHREEHGREPE